MMKVAHVVVGGEVGGGQTICGRILEALRQRGDQVLVVSPTEGDFTRRLRESGIPVHLIPFRKTYHIQDAFRFARLLKREQVHLVHTHAMVPMNVHARLGAKLAGVAVISHLHGPNRFSTSTLVRAYQVFLDNMTARFPDRIISVSESTKQASIAQGTPNGQIDVIYNGISVDRCYQSVEQPREHVLAELGLYPTHRIVGVVGALCPMKGQEEFILAARDVLKQVPEARFLVVGKDSETGGSYEATLRVLVQRLALKDKVIFTGFRPDVLNLVNAFDLFVLPSKVEGLPVTILEAMALKKPVVATRVGGIPEVVLDGETGILVPPGDVPALAEAMLDLLRSPERASRMGQSGYERVGRQFSEEKMIIRILSLYDQVLGMRGTLKMDVIDKPLSFPHALGGNDTLVQRPLVGSRESKINGTNRN